MLGDFRDFIAKGNVMDMAVGIIVGAAFTGIVQSVVSDLINPIIGLFMGGFDFTTITRSWPARFQRGQASMRRARPGRRSSPMGRSPWR